LLFAATGAHAQFGGTLAPPANILQDSAFITQNDLTRAEMLRQQRLNDLRGSGQRTGRDTRATIKESPQVISTVLSPPAERAAAVQKIAAAYPQPKRQEAERVFREMLSGYGKIEQQFGIPKHDVAGSIAAFLAGSYMAYRNTDFPDEHFKPLVAQMRQIIGSNPDFAKASNAEKQEMHEQMAILGMFMATTQMALKEKPNPQIAANMRQAAKGYLEQFLKTDADRVQITAQGLVLK
jgi:hypothetical protein